MGSKRYAQKQRSKAQAKAKPVGKAARAAKHQAYLERQQRQAEIRARQAEEEERRLQHEAHQLEIAREQSQIIMEQIDRTRKHMFACFEDAPDFNNMADAQQVEDWISAQPQPLQDFINYEFRSAVDKANDPNPRIELYATTLIDLVVDDESFGFKVVKAGSTVRATMFSRFMEIGITRRLSAERGYEWRVPCGADQVLGEWRHTRHVESGAKA